MDHYSPGENMTTKKSGRVAAGAAVAAFAIVGLTACGGQTPSVPGLPSNLPSVPGVGDPRAAFGNAHQSALGLAALGGLGSAQGVGQQVKDLAPQVKSEGEALDQKLRGLASAIQVSLPDQVSPEVQAQLDDVKARTGEQFDQGWLQAAQAEQQKLKDQATGLLNIPGLPQDQKDQAKQQVDNLDQLGQKLAAAAGTAGAATPGPDNQAAGTPGQNGTTPGQPGSGTPGQGSTNGTGTGNGTGNGTGAGTGTGSGAGTGKGGPAVDAGTGGQAAEADDPVLPITFGGLGLALIAAAGVWLRRSRA